MNDIPSIGRFDIKDPTAIVARWKRWIRTFEIYADGKGIKNAVQQKALLLHTAGMEVQDVFHKLNLVDDGGDSVYTICRNTLENHTTLQSNVRYERHTFRSMFKNRTR